MRVVAGLITVVAALGLNAGNPLQAQQALAAAPLAHSSCTATGLGVAAVRAPQDGTRVLSLCDGQPLAAGTTKFTSSMPLSLASADFDEDGVPDLVSGAGSGSTGIITVHRGNIGALWPYGAALRNGPPPAFLANPRTFSLPEPPDFLVTGDFDADGHIDVIVAHKGSSAFYFLHGDGRGGFAAPKRIALDGALTAMIAGEINRTDGLTDLILGLTTSTGAKALVYESPLGAIHAEPEAFPVSAPVAALALGRFDGNAMNDLAIASGSDVTLVHARDRKLSLGEAQRASVASAKVTTQHFAFGIRALAVGDFTGGGPSVAALGDDGNVHILEHAVAPGSIFARAAETPSMQIADANGKAPLSDRPVPSQLARAQALRALTQRAAGAPEWTEHSSVALPAGFAQTTPKLIAAHISGSHQDDLLAPDSGNGAVHVLSNAPAMRRFNATADAISHTVRPVAPLQLATSLEASAAPAAILPMRLSKHGLSGLVMLQAGQSAPILMPQDTAPSSIFVVTNTLDETVPMGTVPAGSLRAAMQAAQSASGTAEITFNIPTSDPGYDPTTGAFVIKPISENVPGSLDEFALPPINATVIIDGYTQPGASPNTLAVGSNAKILIRIDGSLATTPGGAGLVPFDDEGSVYRGLDFTGWTDPLMSGGTDSGAEGIEANGVGDFIEGNYFGTDPTGKTAMANRIGIFADNGPLFGSAPGNVIGGTTPQARNVLSGNQIGGVLFFSIAFDGELEGNYIGTDATGEAALGNLDDGVGSNGPTIIIGGTIANTANVISANGTDVDFNDITNGGAASDSFIWGNLIGTDAMGKTGLSSGVGAGASILSGAVDETVGGPSPAMRNIISGNYYGVYLVNNTSGNLVQGNYIGTDSTGTSAIPNVQYGVYQGATDTSQVPAVSTTLGGSTAGTGNLISGNTLGGVSISGTTLSTSYYQAYLGSTIMGNLIGTDISGNNPLPNGGNGIALINSATNNVIGSTLPGSGNVIAFNKGDGVLIDPGTAIAGEGFGNQTIANTLLSNTGAGVRVNSGTTNRISQNSIFGNSGLGIVLGTGGASINTPCNSSNSGPNNLQNAPVMTAGSGSVYVTATATDANGNTSEFSNAVQASLSGDVLSLLGNFNSVANSSYTVEFFSSTAEDPSGYGQGQTYLGSTTVSTDSSCNSTISNPINTEDADVSVKLTSDTPYFYLGADFGDYTFTGTVTNLGPAIAHNVVFTDTLPTGMEPSGAYCNVGPCQSTVTTNLGDCTVNENTITCNMGTMPAGASAQITIPVESTSVGTLTDSATVTATEADPNLVNNSASLNESVDYPFPFADHLIPAAALTQTTGNLSLMVYGEGFIPTTAITFNGTAVSTTGYFDNQSCTSSGETYYCSAVQVSVPASLLGTAGTYTVEATNPDPGPEGESNFPTDLSFTLVSSCTYTVEYFSFGSIEAEGDTLIPEEIEIASNAPGCPWTAVSNNPWIVIVDNPSGTAQYGDVDVMVAPNTGAARTGTLTVAGQSVEIDQVAGDSTVCTYTATPSSAHYTAAGGSGTTSVATGASCVYFVQAFPDSESINLPSFITIPESSGLLVGPGSPAYTVAANHGPARSGVITLAGNTFPITQDAPSCYFTLDSSGKSFPASGGSGSVAVTASSPSCAWTAAPSSSAQVSITSGASGTGNGTVQYTVPVNTGGPITPTITIGDGAGYSIYNITQASAFSCSFTIGHGSASTPGPLTVSSNGTSDSIVVIPSFSFCKWTASVSDPTALTIKGSGSGTGYGGIYFTVGQNTSTSPRTLTITAGCTPFVINQNGTAPTNPAPSITTLSPGSAVAGSAAFTLTVNGSGFINGSTVYFGGVARTTTYVSATQVTAAILAADIASAGTPSVTVTNPSPGGGTSNAVTFNVTSSTNNPVPAITSLSPSSTTAGGSAFTLTVNGTGFVSGSVVNFSGNARATTYVSSTQVTASVLAADVVNVGTPSVTVTNPTPGGGVSNSITFTVSAVANNPVPAITSLSPSNATAGAAAFTLTVQGTGFVSGSVVNFNGNARTTTYVSATQLTAAITAPDIATAATIPVTVTNPVPGGGTSASANFTVNPNTAPQVSFDPTSLTFGPILAGTTTAAQTITLSNTGNATLNIASISITGTNPGDFAQTNTCGESVEPEGNCTISVTFTPASGASFSAAVSVTDNAGGSPQKVNLSGTGTAAPTFTITSGSAAQSVAPGGSVSYSITVTPQNGAFTDPVTLAVSGLPPGATATFSVNPVTPGSSATSSTLTIQTASATTAHAERQSLWPAAAPVLSLAGFFLLSAKRRKRWMSLGVLAIATLGSLAVLSGCGGGFALSGSGGRNYTVTVTVTATSGNIQQSTTVQLTVQ